MSFSNFIPNRSLEIFSCKKSDYSRRYHCYSICLLTQYASFVQFQDKMKAKFSNDPFGFNYVCPQKEISIRQYRSYCCWENRLTRWRSQECRREPDWDRIMTKLALVDTPLRLGDRLVDTTFGSVSASLYCTYTVRVTAMLGDMEDFFTYWGAIGRDDDIRINSFNSQKLVYHSPYTIKLTFNK